MSNINKWMGKCAAATASAMNGMKVQAGNCRQEGVISDLEKQIRQCTLEIGSLVVADLDRQEAPALTNDAIAERYEAIQAARSKACAAADQKVVRRVTCPHCGSKTTAGMRYCGACGELLG